MRAPIDRSGIVFVLSDYGVGGAEKQLANLIANRPQVARAENIHTITFLPPTSEHVAQLFSAAGASNTLIDRSALSFPYFFLRLVRTLRDLKPVLVCTVLNSSVGAWGRLAAIIAGVPLIAHSDRQLEDEGTRSHLLLRPHLDRRTQLFLPNAQAIKEKLVTNGIDEARITVVPNGVDIGIFDPLRVSGLREELAIEPNEVVLGFLGRLAAVKRLDVLIAALETLPPDDRPDRVLIAGDGPFRKSLAQALSRVPWLEARSQLLGAIDSTPEFLATIDYLVLSSESEGLPNVVLESMAMGKPVVSTRVSDVPHMVGNTGYLAEINHPQSLARAIALMQAEGLDGRSKLGLMARQRVEASYTMAKAADQFWLALLGLVQAYRQRAGAQR